MANTNDPRRNGNGKSAPPPADDPVKRQQQEQQEGAENDLPEATNTLALCPQCPFASRSPSEVDEHMIHVHRATLPPDGSQTVESVEGIMNEVAPQLSTLLSLTRAFPGVPSVAFPSIPLLQNNNPGASAEDIQQPIPTPQMEATPCSSSALTQNMPIRTDSRRRYKCSKCPSSFPWHGDLTDHMKTVHGITKSCHNSSRSGTAAIGSASSDGAKSSRSAGTYNCPYCKYNAKYLSELRRHTRLHMGVKPFACIFCSYKSAWKGDLKRHMESHHKDKFKTDDDLARIMAQFKNNAGTTAIDPREEQAVRPCSASPGNSPNSQTNRDTPVPPGLPSTSHADLSLSTTAVDPSQLLIDTLLTLPPTPHALDPRFYPSLQYLASFFTLPAVHSQPSPLVPPPPQPTSPPPELSLPPPPPLPLSAPLSTITPPPAIESLNSLLSKWNWLQFLQTLTPEGLGPAPAFTSQQPEGEQQQQQQPQPCVSTEEPLNLVCKAECLAGPQSVSQASPPQPQPPPAKRRSTRPTRSGRGSTNHVTTITMDPEEAKRTLPAYLERVRAFGRNGRSSATCCSDDMNPSCSNGSGSCHQDREGYIRPYMCSFCGHRSNWKWDLRKHMKNMHGREGKVIILSNEEARRTLAQYKASRRQGQSRMLRWSTTDVSSEPSTSRQCCASEASRGTTVSPDGDTPVLASDGSTQLSDSKMIFPMWKNLAQHIVFHHPGLSVATSLAATAMGNIVTTTVTASSSSSSPIEPTHARLSLKRPLTLPSPSKLSSGDDEQSATEMKFCEIQRSPFAANPLEEPLPSPSMSSTPTSLPESEIVRQRPRLQAKRSLVHHVASSSTQTQNSPLLSTLDNLLSESATNSFTEVFQFAEILKQAVDFLQSLLGEGSQETIGNSNIYEQLLSRLEGDENEPSMLADRSQRLALLLVDPQVQSLTDQLLPLLHRVKQQFNIPSETDDFTQFQQ
ncbi:zinc finger protein 45 [Echinococcus multilocularis]|uniref:Zinc finger protein 45 n=1 Tax=Echinococcus multilocularis TaxID=6211 RepID=A0A087W094_ECHMU|nr:zinc finger protein 45 [Echinococcus multilocularis]